MAKKSTGKKKLEPYLCAALFCERISEEKDNVLSAQRIVDKIVIQPLSPSFPSDAIKPGVSLVALIGFRCGGFKGRRTVNITIKTPSGIIAGSASVPLAFAGKHAAAMLRVNLVLEIGEEGVYWIDVQLDQKLVTKMPLEIEYKKAPTGTSSPSEITTLRPRL